MRAITLRLGAFCYRHNLKNRTWKCGMIRTGRWAAYAGLKLLRRKHQMYTTKREPCNRAIPASTFNGMHDVLAIFTFSFAKRHHSVGTYWKTTEQEKQKITNKKTGNR